MKKFVLIGAIAALIIGGVFASRIIAVPAKDPGPQTTPYPTTSEGWTAEATSGNNSLGFNLFKELNKDAKGNVFFSPTAISMALGMTLNGANRDTEANIHGVIVGSRLADPFRVNSGNRALLQILKNADPKAELNIVNGIWVDNKCPVLPTFIDTNKATYGAEIANIDLTTPAAAKPINEWIAKGTKDKINDLLKPADFSINTRMVLANAVYFKSPWAHPFKEAMTKDGDFTLPDGTTKKVPMMTQTASFNYLENKKVQLIVLHYGERNRLQMNIILPKVTVKPADVSALLTSENWANWNHSNILGAPADQLTARVMLQLPRIKISYQQELNESLKNLGMADAFTDKADFSKITGKKDLQISVVRHQATLDVDEKGTEATAATAVVMPAQVDPAAPQYKMIVNRPFFVVINDGKTGAILFMGLIKDPQE